jgi:thiol-disulfide isomerase/thioredoxin
MREQVRDTPSPRAAQWALALLALVPVATALGASAPSQRIRFEERLTNLEVAAAELSQSSAEPIVREPTPHPAVAFWYGRVSYRAGPDPNADARDASFAVQFRGASAESVWFDANHDADFTDDPPVTLYDYPSPVGARSFFVDMSWRTRHDGVEWPVSRKFRIVLDPVSVGAAPTYRIQIVMGRMAQVTLAGRSHLAVLMDGDTDGLYTEGFGDGVFVDLDDDRHIDVDMMSPEFGPFSVPFDLAGRRYRCRPLDPQGAAIELTDVGPADGGEFAAVGRPAPDFWFTGSEGAPLHLADWRGHWVVVHFWASWCSACQVQADALRELYQRRHPGGFEIVGVSYDEDLGRMRAFRAEAGHPWPTTFSGRRFWEDPVGRRYRARGVGTMYLVRPDGLLEGTYTDVATLESRMLEEGAQATR